MKRQLICAASALALVAGLAGSSRAVTLYSQDFDVDDSANWTINDTGTTDTLADFYYDYSAIGVPAAPGGSTTRGLKMTANNSAGVFGGFSVSPTGQAFAGEYRVEFDMWQNYVGPVGPGGSGTTQLSMFGVGTAGNVEVSPGSAKESVAFGVTLDGGSSVDFRAYSSAAGTGYPDADPVFAAVGTGNRNGNHAYYAGFGGQSAPGDQLTLYPGQTGMTDAGEIAFMWAHVVMEVRNGFASFAVDGLPIASVDLNTVTLGGDNIFFGHSDTNGSSSSDPNRVDLNVTLIDNVVVTKVPEPSTMALGALALSGLAAFRRRR